MTIVTRKSKKKTKKSAQRVKLPTINTLQLGPFQINRSCGCLIFHAERIDRACGHSGSDWGYGMVEGAIRRSSVRRLIPSGTPNTPELRAEALVTFIDTMRGLGFRISKDGKYATRKAVSNAK